MDQKPSIGRVVHYVSFGTPGGEYSSVCRAATITEVGEQSDTVGLCVQNPTGFLFLPIAAGGVWHDEAEKQGGSWHWPERV